MLEAIRILKLASKAKHYQAFTFELFGRVFEAPQSETTPFYQQSPYATTKTMGWVK